MGGTMNVLDEYARLMTDFPDVRFRNEDDERLEPYGPPWYGWVWVPNGTVRKYRRMSGLMDSVIVALCRWACVAKLVDDGYALGNWGAGYRVFESGQTSEVIAQGDDIDTVVITAVRAVGGR